MNRADLRSALRYRLGNPPADEFFTDPVLNSLLDEAVLTLGTEADWPWLCSTGTAITTAAGTATYAIGDSGYTRTRVLSIDGYEPLEERSLAEIRSLGTADRGQPRYYAIVGLTLHLRPVPDGVYSIVHDIVTSETILTGDTDSPSLPEAYSFAAVAKAAELGHLRQRDNERATLQLAEYNAWLGRMRDNLRRTAAPRRIRTRPGSAL